MANLFFGMPQLSSSRAGHLAIGQPMVAENCLAEAVNPVDMC